MQPRKCPSECLISPVPYHRPAPACFLPRVNLAGSTRAASAGPDPNSNVSRVIPVTSLSSLEPAYTPGLFYPILHKDEKNPLLCCLHTLGLAPVFFLPSWRLCLRLGCCVPCRWLWAERRRRSPCEAAGRRWQWRGTFLRWVRGRSSCSRAATFGLNIGGGDEPTIDERPRATRPRRLLSSPSCYR